MKKTKLETIEKKASTEPQVVCCAYVSGYKHRFTYCV